MYPSGIPTIFSIDDYFVCDSYGNSKFAQLYVNKDNNEIEIWPLIIEKAFAKLIGGY